ncbi:MAG: hypothetical protein ACYCW6_03755, partial [Candidatus Xenobia bacterium]
AQSILEAHETLTTLDSQIEKLAQMIAEHPDDLSLLKAYAEANLLRGHHLEALQAYQKVAVVLPDEVEVRLALARIYLMQRMYRESYAEVMALLAATPGLAGGYLLLRKLQGLEAVPQEFVDQVGQLNGFIPQLDEINVLRGKLTEERQQICQDITEFETAQSQNGEAEPVLEYFIKRAQGRREFVDDAMHILDTWVEALHSKLDKAARIKALAQQLVDQARILAEQAAHLAELEGQAASAVTAAEATVQLVPEAQSQVEEAQAARAALQEAQAQAQQAAQGAQAAAEQAASTEDEELVNAGAAQVQAAAEAVAAAVAVATAAAARADQARQQCDQLREALLAAEREAEERKVQAVQAATELVERARALAEQVTGHASAASTSAAQAAEIAANAASAQGSAQRAADASAQAASASQRAALAVEEAVSALQATTESANAEEAEGHLVRAQSALTQIEGAIGVAEVAEKEAEAARAEAETTANSMVDMYAPALPAISEGVGILGKTRNVAAALVISDRGLIVHKDIKEPLPEDFISTFVKSAVELTRSAGESAHTTFNLWVLEFDKGLLVLNAIDPHHVLVVHGGAGANFGALKFAIDKAKPQLASALSGLGQ